MAHAFAHLLRLLLPPACPLCGGSFSADLTAPFCRSCMAEIPALPPRHCPRCALPFIDSAGTEPHLCSRCILHPPAYLKVYAPALYEGQLRQAIQRFKFQQRPGLDRSLARLISRVLPADLEMDLLIPVPLHSNRLRQRTYNQSLLLARELGRCRQYPVGHALLTKVRETDPQQTLTARERRKNLENAFQLQGDVRGKKILLVDDVMTTGVTVELCSQVLVAGGATEVRIAVVGRAP